MIVRPATLADLNACLLIDHSSATDHVWQMQVRESESQVGVTFHAVRLPRQMRVEYPRDIEQLVEDWHREEAFLVAEADSEVRGYVDLLSMPWQQMGWVANLAVERNYRRRGIATADGMGRVGAEHTACRPRRRSRRRRFRPDHGRPHNRLRGNRHQPAVNTTNTVTTSRRPAYMSKVSSSRARGWR